MKTLLIIAHGSSRQESNEEVCRMAAQIKDSTGFVFDLVSTAFLEIASPLVDSAIADLVGAGADTIVVFPYFLASGSHVANDIPRLLKEARQTHPFVSFQIIPHLGALQGISSLILNHIRLAPSIPA